MRQKLVILSGAGMSAESGFSTFRDSDGLWERYPVEQVATPEGWRADPTLVTNFYNHLRRLLVDARPNEGHRGLVALENQFDVTIVTQNVDDLHERAGSSHVIHLHGELMKHAVRAILTTHAYGRRSLPNAWRYTPESWLPTALCSARGSYGLAKPCPTLNKRPKKWPKPTYLSSSAHP